MMSMLSTTMRLTLACSNEMMLAINKVGMMMIFTFQQKLKVDDSILWLPLTEEEPVLDPDVLAMMDSLADKFEVDRLLTMGVLEKSTGTEDSSNYGSSLTGKFVRTFRKKERDGQDVLVQKIKIGGQGIQLSFNS